MVSLLMNKLTSYKYQVPLKQKEDKVVKPYPRFLSEV
jgi:hypothetical protein